MFVQVHDKVCCIHEREKITIPIDEKATYYICGKCLRKLIEKECDPQ